MTRRRQAGSSKPVRAALFDAAIGALSDPFVLDGDLALAIVTERRTANSLYKAELIRRHRTWRTTEEVDLATAVWVSWWNESRIHSACRDIPSAEFEEAYHRQLEATVAA
jgi:putative transposase